MAQMYSPTVNSLCMEVKYSIITHDREGVSLEACVTIVVDEIVAYCPSIFHSQRMCHLASPPLQH